MSTLWQRVIDHLHAAQIAYCVLRDGAAPGADGSSDIDLLVDPRDLSELEDALIALGFVRLRAWGYAPHRFFLGYDEPADRWLKLDVVTRIACGRPAHAIETSLGERCLQHRRLADGVYVPAPGHELTALLLHGIIDKRAFPAHRQARLRQLCDAVDAEQMNPLLPDYWVERQTWPVVREAIVERRWNELLSLRGELIERLTQSNRPGYRWRQVRDWTLRKLGRLARLWCRDVPAVALLAPDGAGKSTVAAGLCDTFYFPVRRIYMGLPPRARGRTRRRVPGWGLLMTLWHHWSRSLAARFHRARGRLVVFDRYTYDALVPSLRPQGRLRRLRRWLVARACPAPDLVLVLDAPGEVLFDRKGEHSVAQLESQRQAYRQLPSWLPQTVILDATRDADRVRSAATAAIWRNYVDRQVRRGGRRR